MMDEPIFSMIADGLKECDLDHGGEENNVRASGHKGSVRVCLRIYGTDRWVYDPHWEEKESK